MKLYISGNSPYARRARIAVREAGLSGDIEEVPISGFDQLLAFGPGAKIPVLVTNSGNSLSESLIITRFINDLAGGRLLPRESDVLEKCLVMESVACVLMDALFVRSVEKNHRDAQSQSSAVLDKEAERSRRCYDRLDELTVDLSEPVNLASIAAVAAVGYADWRTPEDNWREGRPHLKSYYDTLMQRPAFSATAPSF